MATPTNFQYIPGYLAFREVHFLLDLIDELRKNASSKVPDCIMVDGNGILHPARFGLACHLGVLSGAVSYTHLTLPTILLV